MTLAIADPMIELLGEALTDAQIAEYGEFSRRLRQVESADYVYAEQTWHDERVAELGEECTDDQSEEFALIGELVADHQRKRTLCQVEIDRRARAGKFAPNGASVLDYSDARRAIKQRTIELIGGYTALRKNGREHKGLCPFHDDHHPSLRVNAEKGLWYCDPCAIGGDVFDFVMRRDKCDFPTALRELARRTGVELPKWKHNGGQAAEAKTDDSPIESLIDAIPLDIDRVQLARALDPILRRLATMERAEAQAILWHTIKPRFKLTYKDAQGYERTLSELRRELKAQAADNKKVQAQLELQKQHEKVERERAERAKQLLAVQVSFVDLHSRLHDLLGNLHDLLEIILAVSATPKVKPPIWLFVVGAPSSGKTEEVRLLRSSPQVYYLDTMTENAFVSGYVRPDGSDPQDLLPLLEGKAFVCKDLTTLFSLQEDTIRKLLGDLSSIYDGEFRKHTATRGEIAYESSFSFIACITPAALNAHQRYLNIIGPRFLTYRVPPMSAEQVEKGFEALWQKGSRAKQLDALRDLVSAYSFQLSQKDIAAVEVDKDARIYLKRLANLLARGRGVIVTNRTRFKDDAGQDREWTEVVESQIEEPWRAYSQIEALVRALALVHSRNRVTPHELELARRVTLASMPPARGDALAFFADPTIREQGHIVASDMSNRLGTSPRTARNLLEELQALKILTKAKEGTQATRYAPNKEFADLVFESRTELDHIADYESP